MCSRSFSGLLHLKVWSGKWMLRGSFRFDCLNAFLIMSSLRLTFQWLLLLSCFACLPTVSVSIQFCLLHLTTSVLFDTRLNSYADRPYFIANRHSNSNRCQHFWYGFTHIPTCSNRKKNKNSRKKINNVMCQYSIPAANTDTRNRKRAMLCSMNIIHTHTRVVKAHNSQKTNNMSMQDHLVVV